jgi:exopolyphosphatase/pppGpp-phosphohydrolase
MNAVDVVLHLGAEGTEVLVSGAEHAPVNLHLSLTAQEIASRFFHTDPPSALAVEMAIEAVEEQVMQARAIVPEACAVHWTATHAQRVMAWAAASPGNPNPEGAAPTEVSVEQLEALFNRLVGRVEGRPASSDPVPTDAAFAATVLIVREFLHHTLSRSLIT